jgi:hypothetical protein
MSAGKSLMAHLSPTRLDAMRDLVNRLRERRITGLFGNHDPNDWGVSVQEGVDPLCQEAADCIDALIKAIGDKN